MALVVAGRGRNGATAGGIECVLWWIGVVLGGVGIRSPNGPFYGTATTEHSTRQTSPVPLQSTTRLADLAILFWSSKGSREVGRGTLPCFLGLFRGEPGRSAQMRPEGGRGAFQRKIPATAAP